ncbi:hypothetical protein [Variovorax sp. PBL-H6]|uniref:hypothetical protein n=1 Tax=Variovorax sp. PBL-H6 TaxID=434009 RepID=UPI0013A56742|nr:hypothetical protein [Variovorax sp. PBL-H6]
MTRRPASKRGPGTGHAAHLPGGFLRDAPTKGRGGVQAAALMTGERDVQERRQRAALAAEGTEN